jgi:hypothetical protein
MGILALILALNSLAPAVTSEGQSPALEVIAGKWVSAVKIAEGQRPSMAPEMAIEVSGTQVVVTHGKAVRRPATVYMPHRRGLPLQPGVLMLRFRQSDESTVATVMVRQLDSDRIVVEVLNDPPSPGQIGRSISEVFVRAK